MISNLADWLFLLTVDGYLLINTAHSTCPPTDVSLTNHSPSQPPAVSSGTQTFRAATNHCLTHSTEIPALHFPSI